MTQQEINLIWEKLESKNDHDREFEFKRIISDAKGEVVSGNWQKYGGLVDSVFHYMEKHGFLILENPEFEGTDTYSWIIFKV